MPEQTKTRIPQAGQPKTPEREEYELPLSPCLYDGLFTKNVVSSYL